MNRLAAGALAVAVLALILSCVGLFAPSGDDELGKELDELRRGMTSLSVEIAELSSRIETRATRARKAPLPAPEIDLAEISRLIDERIDERIDKRVDERVREAIALAGGKARLGPEALPQVVKDAVDGVLEGARIVRAEQRSRRDRTYYRLKARLGDEEYDLRIWADGEVLEAELPPDRAPEAVKVAAARTVEGIRLTQVRRRINDGLPFFDLEGRFDGEKYDMKIAPDGEVIEAELPPDRAPEAVKVAAARTVEGIRLTQVRRKIDNNRPIYDIEGRLDGKKYDMKIAPDGLVIDADLWPDGVTQAMRDAAAGAVEGIRLTDAQIDTDDGRAIYEIEGEAGGDDYRIKLTLDGRLIEIRGPDGKRKFDPGREPAPVPEAPKGDAADPGVF